MSRGLAALLSFVVLHSSACAGGPELVREGVDVCEDTKESVSSLPAWGSTFPLGTKAAPPFAVEEIRQYVDAAAGMADLGVEQLRGLVKAVGAEAENQIEEELVHLNYFVLWRILYQVPDDMKHEEMNYQSPHSSAVSRIWLKDGVKWYPSSWPIEIVGGKIVKLDSLGGMHGVYQPTMDLEELAKQFSRRTKSQILSLRP